MGEDEEPPEPAVRLSAGKCVSPICLTTAGDLPLLPKVYCGICVILLMSVMNTETWAILDIGFVGLLYCVYGFALS